MKNTWICFSLCVLLGALFVLPAYGIQSKEELQKLLTPENMKKLEGGAPLVLEGKSDGDGKSGEGLVLIMINRPKDKIWEGILDYPSYPEFMPKVVDTKVYFQEENKIGVAFTVKVAWKKVRYSIMHTTDKEAGVITWEVDKSKENDIVESIGSWTIMPQGEDKCILAYTLVVETGVRVPGFVQNFLLKNDLPNVPKAVKKHLESQ